VRDLRQGVSLIHTFRLEREKCNTGFHGRQNSSVFRQGNAADPLWQVPALSCAIQRLLMDALRFNIDPPQTRTLSIPYWRFTHLIVLARKDLKGGHEKIKRKFKKLLLHFDKHPKSKLSYNLNYPRLRHF
jgi:hypothetical protein